MTPALERFVDEVDEEVGDVSMARTSRTATKLYRMRLATIRTDSGTAAVRIDDDERNRDRTRQRR